MRLSLKISVATVLAISLVLLAAGYYSVRREMSLLHTDIMADHRELGRALALATSAAAERADAQGAQAFLTSVNAREDRIHLRWVASPGAAHAASGDVVQQETHETDGGHFFVTRVPLSIGQPGYLELRESMHPDDSFIRGTALRIGALTLLLITLSTLIIFGFGYVLLGWPLRLVVAKARRIGEGDLGQPLVLQQRDEMGELAAEMNAMCTRLAAAQERAQAETRRRIATSEQLQHADRLTTVGKMAAGVAHELGTPLGVIAARAQLVSQNPNADAAVKKDAEIIHRQAQRITHIIRQMLDFGRREPGHKQRGDLHGIVETTIELLEPIAARQNVRLVDNGDATPTFAPIDAPQIQQVLTNLAMNALQAQPTGGEVRIGVFGQGSSVVPCASRDDGAHYVGLVVEDDGPGISNEVRERMFEPFFTTKEVGKGTGLGLSVVYGMVEEHHGSIHVDSAPGRGTRICVLLPADEAA